jgi:antagonist of KipI
MEVTIFRPGMLTTVQDLGRHGHRDLGVTSGGAMDAFALRLANLLVGNDVNAAGLEMTLTGAELEFSADTLVAVAGADMGALTPLRPHRVKAGQRLKFGRAKRGCRTYLAIAGGLQIKPVLGGCGTDLRSGFGGHAGRALRAGDVLKVDDVKRDLIGAWFVDQRMLPNYSATPAIRVVVGAEAAEFSGGICRHEFAVSGKSDRMGIRLEGARYARNSARQLVSSAVAPGTIQVPPDGEPIVLMTDAQTIGGYPRIAHVIAADLPLLAQLQPGDKLRFVNIKIAEAHRVWRERERHFGLLAQGLRLKIQ